MSKLTNKSCRRLCIQICCYLAVLYNIAVFTTNVILYVKDISSWKEDSNTEWVGWQWLDLAISGVSILVAIFLYGALIMSNHKLLQAFLIWTILCIVLSILVLAFGFRELERDNILARCIGIVVSAYFAVVVFSYHLTLKEYKQVKAKGSPQKQSYSLERISSCNSAQSNMVNGGFHIEDEMSKIEAQNNTRNVRLWYEDTKL